MPEWLAWSVLALTAGTLFLLIPLALHRTHLVLRARRPREEREEWSGPPPHVTVQLPVFDEADVVERLIDHAASLDHPRERLEIQVLDDSRDETTVRAAARVRHWQEAGVRIRHLHRTEREGYKAGALQAGLEAAEGEFLVVLDADFVPAPDLIRRLLGPFQDPEVGMVQARWDHLNEGRSLLTRCQALLLDAHFFLEQGGRWAAGCFMSFNGTAGMWRRSALLDAGGWSSDTLTEDLDVSYRSQMAGWRFVFRPEVGVPAELPESVRALEVQQRRWAQGGVQTGRKILPRLLSGSWPSAVKIEAVFHLFGHLAHPLTLLLGLLLMPSAVARSSLGLEGLLHLDLLVFLGATASFLTFYGAAGRRRARPWPALVPRVLATMALGIGLTATVSGAVLRGLLGGGRDPFLRTPKRGDGEVRYRSPGTSMGVPVKAALTGWMVFSCAVAVAQGLYATLPFTLLFGSGYAWLLVGELRELRRPPVREGSAATTDSPSGEEAVRSGARLAAS